MKELVPDGSPNEDRPERGSAFTLQAKRPTAVEGPL